MAAVVLVWCYDSLLSYFVVIFDKLRCILTQQPGLRRRRQYIAAVVAAAHNPFVASPFGNRQTTTGI